MLGGFQVNLNLRQLNQNNDRPITRTSNLEEFQSKKDCIIAQVMQLDIYSNLRICLEAYKNQKNLYVGKVSAISFKFLKSNKNFIDMFFKNKTNTKCIHCSI